MSSKDKIKIVTIEDKQYQIGRFTPEVGSYIAMNILATIIKTQQSMVQQNGNLEPAPADKRDPQEIVRGLTFAAYLSGLEYELHCFIQKQCLNICSRMEGQPGQDLLPMPLAKLPDVLADMLLVMRLQTEALSFNLSDFFAGGGLQAMTTGKPQPSSKVISVSQKA